MDGGVIGVVCGASPVLPRGGSGVRGLIVRGAHYDVRCTQYGCGHNGLHHGWSRDVRRRKTMAKLQGLDRGLRALNLISLAPEGISVAELATQLEIDRAIAYRIVETLEAHDLITRGQGKRVRLGAGTVTLAGRFQPQLLRVAEPVLQQLADETGTAAFLTVAQGADECVPVLGAEPMVHHGPVQVGYRIGMRHPLSKGANGIAILALLPARPDEPEEVARARDIGYSVTSGQLQQGATGLAAGFEVPGSLGASVGVVAMDELDSARIAVVVVGAAARLASLSEA
ncbi:helix-turn-helix domain-containing protein [Streptomyces malaysiensis]|nr:helix-turn-helix domain-containing protein [Streptomyces malaysiensis]